MRQIDILITSSSRYDCLKRCIESFFDYVLFNGVINVYLHEDVVPEDREESHRLINWVGSYEMINQYLVSDPCEGRGPALNKLKRFIAAPYIIYLEGDFDFVRFINLNTIYDLMEDYPEINQVAFNCIQNKSSVEKPGPDGQEYFFYECQEFCRNKIYTSMLVSERWNWIPAIWRTEFVLPKWGFATQYACRAFNRELKKDCEDEWSPEWYTKNIGAYILGKVGDPSYCVHIADDRRRPRHLL